MEICNFYEIENYLSKLYQGYHFLIIVVRFVIKYIFNMLINNYALYKNTKWISKIYTIKANSRYLDYLTYE